MKTRRYLPIFILIVLSILLFSCEVNLDGGNVVRTGTVSLRIVDAEALRSILPEATDIAGYSVTLTNQNKSASPASYTNNFQKGTSITFENVLVGTYTITVDGYSDTSYKTKVATGKTELTVAADGANSATVTLDWLDEGNGSFSITIDWKELTNESNLISDAINNKSLGFQAWDNESNTAFNGAEVKMATESDFENRTFTYSQDNIPTTKNERSTNISFRIHSVMDGSDQVIAETFYTTVSILPNINSTPDENDSFSLNNSNIVYYLKNVTGVTSKLNDTDSAKKIDISWEYPKLNDGSYKLVTWITNNDTSSTVDSKTILYKVEGNTAVSWSDEDGKAIDNGKTVTFDGLDPKYTYTVHFKNYTNDESLSYSYSAEILPLENIKTKVKVEAIAFENTFATTYVMGDSAAVGAVITPDEATYKGYTVSVTNTDSSKGSATLSDKTVTFPYSGDYKVTLTSEDGDAVTGTAEKTVTVRLAVPENFTLEKTSEGMKLTWSAVDGADSYTIEKSCSSKTETLTAENTTYTDSSVVTGTEYTYRVKAVKEKSKFDSDYSAEQKGTITNTSITVEVPENVTGEEFASLIKSALNEQYVTDQRGIALTIDTSSSVLLSKADTTFTWLVNGKKIGDDNSRTVTIDSSNVDIRSSETSNTLQLTAKNGDYTYSASAIVHYIDVDPGTVSIYTEGDVDTVRYGTPLQLHTSTEHNNDAVIVWSSSNETVATVSSTGVVTAIEDGTTTITATIAATGKSATKTISTYIPVEGIELTQSSSNWLAIEKTGVSITNGAYKSKTLTAKVVPANGKKATNATLTWKDANNNNSITLSSSGDTATVSSKNNGGSPVVTVSCADGVSASVTIPVYDFDIYYNGGRITGTETKMVGNAIAWNYNEYNVCAYINGSSASNFDIAYFSWSADKSSSLKFTQSENTFNYKIEISTNALDVKITSKIYDKTNKSEIGEMSFTRTPS